MITRPRSIYWSRCSRMRTEVLHWVKTDPDLDAIRDNPRFTAMLAAAEARLAQSPAPEVPTASR